MKITPRHFLELRDVAANDLRHIIDMSASFKRGESLDNNSRLLSGRALAMIFEKPSTRTRVSFEVAMKQLGGHVVILSPNEMQIGRGETIADTARVLSRYVDVIMMRTNKVTKLSELASHAEIPVINGLTDHSHPCQLMADIMTFEEHRGDIAGKRIAWCGDGNNMSRSWVEAAARFNFELRLACPTELAPPQDTIDWARSEGATIVSTTDPNEAVDGVDCVVTDTWVSMGDSDVDRRRNLLEPYRVDRRLMDLAAKDAIFMHCLPAHRDEEITAEILDGPQSVIWDEAENRLHAQKGILAWCLS
ncbi:MAG: ornithine carbamoyltransferase [Pseudomonadota bacterium]|nr:ornithine carbamoyltransferase [Pseudomonadota bacterium]MEC8288735.1 ornithine carbamoyltransferase [Pseudomonadota bacterium]MEC8461681.1 ornithine carbamoyltransferase [Pseudomonadota bacterium]MEC8531121.1 ornithine carbamoyltransferase [Pseudomonadota bacterium]MEC8724671.1 ornithine carbamoyltransferase [Pseudomonadota bacterium]